MKLNDVVKVISTVATLLFAASEVIRQVRLYQGKNLLSEPEEESTEETN